MATLLFVGQLSAMPCLKSQRWTTFRPRYLCLGLSDRIDWLVLRGSTSQCFTMSVSSFSDINNIIGSQVSGFEQSCLGGAIAYTLKYAVVCLLYSKPINYAYIWGICVSKDLITKPTPSVCTVISPCKWLVYVLGSRHWNRRMVRAANQKHRIIKN